MCFTPSLSSTQSVSFCTQFPHDLSSPSSPGGCRRAQHLFDIPDVKIHLLFRSDAFAGSCRPSPWPRSAGPLLPPLLPHGGHAALHRRGQWRETISPARGECPPVSPRCGENLRGAHGPAGLEQAQLTRPPQGWVWWLFIGPTEPGASLVLTSGTWIPGSAPQPKSPPKLPPSCPSQGRGRKRRLLPREPIYYTSCPEAVWSLV